MNNRKTILLITASLLVGLLMPFFSKLAVLILFKSLAVSFVLKTAFTPFVFDQYLLRLGSANVVPFVILSIVFLDTNRIKAREVHYETGGSHKAYRFSLRLSVLYACYVVVSSLYVNIASYMNDYFINPHMYRVSIIIDVILFLTVLVAANMSLARSVRNG